MIIDGVKEKCITMLLRGENITNISKQLQVSRQAIYDWLGNPEFAKELDRRRQEIKTAGNNMILNQLHGCIDELIKIAYKGESEKVRSDTAQYLINRVLGTPTNKVQQSTTESKDETSESLVLDAIKKEKKDE